MKGNNLSKILNVLIALIALIGGILFVRIFMQDGDALQTDGDLQNKVISPIIYFATILFYIAVIIAVCLSLWNMVKNPKNLKKTFIGIIILAVILLFAYLLASSDAVLDAAGNIIPGGEAGTSTNKWVGTGIWYSIILGGIASLFFLFDLIKGLIKS